MTIINIKELVNMKVLLRKLNIQIFENWCSSKGFNLNFKQKIQKIFEKQLKYFMINRKF